MLIVSLAIIMMVQVKSHESLLRWGHSATAFTLSPSITEVAIFGGAIALDGSTVLSHTTVLRFG